MNIQALLVAYTKGTIDSVLPTLQEKAIKRTITSLDKQLKLVQICTNPDAIPHAEKMKGLKILLTSELNKRGVSS